MWEDWLPKFVREFTSLAKAMETIREESVKLAVTARSKNVEKGAD